MLARASSGVWQHLLPHNNHHPEPSIPAIRVSLVAVRVRYLIEQLISVEIKSTWLTAPHSRVITNDVLDLVWDAGGDDKACVIFALLACRKQRSLIELAESELHRLRVAACERIAKLMIDSVKDDNYLFTDVLLKRYSILLNGNTTSPTSAVELAVDFHAIRVINAHNFQRCINALWRGYYHIQYYEDGRLIVGPYKYLISRHFRDHFDPQRIKVPLYQNLLNLLFTLIFMVLYTISVNTPNEKGEIDAVEGTLFAFALGFFFDEVVKIYKGGLMMIGFWNAYNLFVYAIFAGCFILRIIDYISFNTDPQDGIDDRILSYDLLACLAPFLYCRQLLYLDFFRFFGTMIIVLKKMLKETAVFFLLLVVIVAGFLQSFFALDSTNGNLTVMKKVLHSMTQAFLDAPDFGFYEDLTPPFGIYLFYLYNFIVSILLLNILIALFNQAYSVVTDNAVDEFLALFSNKTIEYIRAPDENTFCPPLNLIEICFLIPLQPFLTKPTYHRLNEIVMTIIYSPILCLIALYESKIQARTISARRLVGLADDENSQGWEIEDEFSPERSGWADKVKTTIPHIEEDGLYLLKELKKDMKELNSNISHGGISSS